ncbi:3-oxoadipate enol-lactonase [Caulobacter soli]|uniref:3-oxoadipate enol-lactonase n=1 Tax=Caulobacter soli TaxID=2708539 RepID=UPI0013ECF551|nr:3-oxoadipate enol-lactonase [Caulobacter soli]
MAFTRTEDGTRLHWRLDGAEPRPTLVLLNSIGTDIGLYDRAVPLLTERFRVLRIDTRGHGASDAPDGDYSLERLAADIWAVIDESGTQPVLLCGTSLGGMIAMQMALSAPERVPAMVLACTSAQMDPAAWQARRDLVLDQGMASIADLALERFFSAGFRNSHAPQVGAVRSTLIGMDAKGYAGCAAAIRDMRLASRLAEISAPCLVLCGTQDVSTPYAGHGETIVRGVQNARVAFLETGHLPSIEDPEGFTRAVLDFDSSL